jgi:hypothetical protein
MYITTNHDLDTAEQVHEAFLHDLGVERDSLNQYDSYLEGVEGWKRTAIATILNNQSLYHGGNIGIEAFGFRKANALDILAQAWEETPLFDWVGVWPMRRPVDRAYTQRLDGLYGAVDLSAKTRMMKLCYSFANDSKEDALSCLKGVLVHEYRADIESEVLRDISNNCGLVGDLDLSSFNINEWSRTIELKMKEIGVLIDIKASRERSDSQRRFPTWVAMHPEVFSLFFKATPDSTGKYPLWTGPSVRVNVESWYPKDEILMGWKGNDYQVGYQYCPYIPLTPTVGFKEMNSTQYALLARHGKRLVDKNLFGKLELKGI